MTETTIYALLLLADLFAGGFLFGWSTARKASKPRKEDAPNA